MNPRHEGASYGFECRRDRPVRMGTAHQHDDIELNVASETLHYLVDGVGHEVPPGRIACFWAARPHQLVNERPAEVFYWMTVPLPLVLSWSLPDEFLRSVLQGEFVVVEQVAANFSRWTEDLSGASSDDGRLTAALEVHALLRRIAAVSPTTRTGKTTSSTLGSERAGLMASFIAANATSDIRVEDVARAVHLHPNYAMALFKSTIGKSIGQYLNQCRVAHAQRLLLTTRHGIQSVGTMAGFQSQSQFHERFRQASGLTPAAYRRALMRPSGGGELVGVEDGVAVALLGEEALPVLGEVLIDGVAGDQGVEVGGQSALLGP